MDMLFLALLATILLALYFTPTQLNEEPDPFLAAQMHVVDSEVEVGRGRELG